MNFLEGGTRTMSVNRRGCNDCLSQVRLNGRGFVKAGVLGTAGLSLGQLLQAEARAANRPTRRPSVIILWMRGGPSHIDMWDPKPDAPEEYCGEFGVSSTRVPGIQVGEYLPALAARADRFALVRSPQQKYVWPP